MRLRFLEWFPRPYPKNWPEVRTKGKLRFFVSQWLPLILILSISRLIFDIVLEHRPPSRTLVVEGIVALLLIPAMGVISWLQFESTDIRYRKAQEERGPTGRDTPPLERFRQASGPQPIGCGSTGSTGSTQCLAQIPRPQKQGS